MEMNAGTLRSIEGFGVPVMVMVSIVVGTIMLSSSFTEYQAETDARISRVERSVQNISQSVEQLAEVIKQQQDNRGHFDRASCQEFMMALKIANPMIKAIDCFSLPSSLRNSHPQPE